MSRIKRFVESRRAAAAIGQYCLRFSSIDVLRHKISRGVVEIELPEDEVDVLRHEAWKIIIGDCYHLDEMLPRGARSVLDIGGNIGLFAAACRLRHPSVAVHSYEPNARIRDLFIRNVSSFRCAPYPYAIGQTSGFAQMVEGTGSLHGRTVAIDDPSGLDGEAVLVRSFSSAVDALGGVDLLKLDCEGAEWNLLADERVWSRVRAITMEYHLWARPGATEETLKDLLRSRGYQVRKVEPSPNGPWGMLTAERLSDSSVTA